MCRRTLEIILNMERRYVSLIFLIIAVLWHQVMHNDINIGAIQRKIMARRLELNPNEFRANKVVEDGTLGEDQWIVERYGIYNMYLNNVGFYEPGIKAISFHSDTKVSKYEEYADQSSIEHPNDNKRLVVFNAGEERKRLTLEFDKTEARDQEIRYIQTAIHQISFHEFTAKRIFDTWNGGVTKWILRDDGIIRSGDVNLAFTFSETTQIVNNDRYGPKWKYRKNEVKGDPLKEKNKRLTLYSLNRITDKLEDTVTFEFDNKMDRDFYGDEIRWKFKRWKKITGNHDGSSFIFRENGIFDQDLELFIPFKASKFERGQIGKVVVTVGGNRYTLHFDGNVERTAFLEEVRETKKESFFDAFPKSLFFGSDPVKQEQLYYSTVDPGTVLVFDLDETTYHWDFDEFQTDVPDGTTKHEPGQFEENGHGQYTWVILDNYDQKLKRYTFQFNPEFVKLMEHVGNKHIYFYTATDPLTARDVQPIIKDVLGHNNFNVHTTTGLTGRKEHNKYLKKLMDKHTGLKWYLKYLIFDNKASAWIGQDLTVKASFVMEVPAADGAVPIQKCNRLSDADEHHYECTTVNPSHPNAILLEVEDFWWNFAENERIKKNVDSIRMAF